LAIGEHGHRAFGYLLLDLRQIRLGQGEMTAIGWIWVTVTRALFVEFGALFVEFGALFVEFG
jgi:hypothetical protein